MFVIVVALRKKQKQMVGVYLIFLFTIYPTMCASSGETFRCFQIHDEAMVKGGTSARHLKIDPSIRCDTADGTHQYYQTFDLIFMALYPIGIPSFFMWMLWPHRQVLLERDENKSAVASADDMPEGTQHLGILCVQYEPEYWWFEIFECLRKWLLVSGVLSPFVAWPSSQILAAIMVAFIAVSVFQYTAPYIHSSDDILAYTCHVTLLSLIS